MKGSVRKRGEKWEYYFDLGKDADGKRRRKSKCGFNTKSECEKALALAIAEFQNTGRVTKESNLSVDQYMKYWYEKHVMVKCRYKTQVDYKRIIDKDISPYLGYYYLKNLTPRTVQDFLDMHYQRGVSKSTMDMIFSVLKYSLDMAVFPYEFIKENPSRYIKMKYKFNKVDVNRISLEDAQTVLSYLRENYYNYYIPYLIMFHTGLRRSECIGLTWDNIDFENKILKVRHQALFKNGNMVLAETKTPSSVGDIIIGDTLRNELIIYKEVLKEKRVNHNFVCVNTNYEHMTLNNFNWVVRKIKTDLNIRANAHSFRHLHGQILLENKANIKGIQQRMRHANVKTTLQTYLRSSDKIDNETINIWEHVL